MLNSAQCRNESFTTFGNGLAIIAPFSLIERIENRRDAA